MNEVLSFVDEPLSFVDKPLSFVVFFTNRLRKASRREERKGRKEREEIYL
ncbi:hypothetical protein [Nostoc sp. NOS(2021)]|nr:hypothetical protein [Nostoc sp. NOS(2021)]